VRSALLPAAGLTALALGLSACNGHPSGAVAAGQPPVVVPPAASPAAPVEEPAAQESPTAPASPTALPSPKPLPPSYDVKAVQRQLATLGYYGSAIDGERGPALRSAVMAFQKVQGIGADGIVGKGTLAALKAPRTPKLKASSPADRVEVDLTKQVLYVVKAGAIARILPVSSGNGSTYLQKNGHKAKALSPVGWYKIQRRILGAHKADLGTLYDPQYFYRGWAIHGSNSVPAYPASHGCIRVTRADAKYLLTAIGVGTSVYVYGGSYTFTAGSSAPGTDNPTGDTSGDTPTASPSATPSPRTSAAPSGSPSAGPSGSPAASPSPSASPTPVPTPTH
jgi:peptidoglycan hydrolase-like protein with peptidoglycan-binding domain